MLSDDPNSDPTYDANALPLVTWLEAQWKGWATHDQMKLAFKFANGKAGNWGTVIGPAGAVLATLKRLGWSALAWDRWRIPRHTITGGGGDHVAAPPAGSTVDGLVLDLQEVGIHILRKIVDQATTKQLLMQARLERFQGAPLLGPAISLIKELRQAEDFQGAGLLRTWQAGGFWTQEQLYHHG